jgi:hypothetical protein
VLGIFLTVVLGTTSLGLLTSAGGVLGEYYSSAGPPPEFGRCGRSSQATPSIPSNASLMGASRS